MSTLRAADDELTVKLPKEVGRKKVIVIGGGVGGCEAAIQLAEAGYDVTLLEKNTELLAGTSNATAWRAGLFHYPHLATAKKCMNTVIELKRKYAGIFPTPQTKSEPDNDPTDTKFQLPGNTHYYVDHESEHTVEDIEKLFGQLRDYYRELIVADPDNKVLGEPDDLFRRLNLEEYQGFVSADRHIAAAFKTIEPTLDWLKFKSQLKRDVFRRVNVVTGANVVAAEPDGEGRYTISYRQQNGDDVFVCDRNCDAVVNATYHGIEKINAMAGLESRTDCTKTHRLKALVTVKAPDSVIAQLQALGAGAHFICYGRHASISLREDNYVIISYEPETVMETTQGELGKLAQRVFSGDFSEDDKEQLANKIIAGVAKYFPGMAEAKYKAKLENGNGTGLSFGIVSTQGSANDIDMRHHEDVYFHGTEDGRGNACWVDLFTSKLTRAVADARVLVQGLTQRFINKAKAEKRAERIAELRRSPLVDRGSGFSYFFGGPQGGRGVGGRTGRHPPAGRGRGTSNSSRDDSFSSREQYQGEVQLRASCPQLMVHS